MVGLLVSLVLLVVAVAPGRVADLFAGDSLDSPSPAAAAAAAETARPTQAPPAGTAQRPTVDEPYDPNVPVGQRRPAGDACAGATRSSDRHADVEVRNW